MVEQYQAFRQCEADMRAAEELLADPDMRELAQAELEDGKVRLGELELALQKLCCRATPTTNAIFFWKSALAPAAMSRHCLLLICSACTRALPNAIAGRWKSSPPASPTWAAIKEIIARLVGFGAYSKLKFESGGHRVQRVPATETQGRIHTSACTVAGDAGSRRSGMVNINPAELRIDTFRASGAGGQHINKTDLRRARHPPAHRHCGGMPGRPQPAQKQGPRPGRAGLAHHGRATARTPGQRSRHPQSLVGSGDRSERIRTYNFPQGRVTDHRINLTLYKLDQVMDGDLFELTEALSAEHQAEQLAAMGSEASAPTEQSTTQHNAWRIRQGVVFRKAKYGA